MQLKKRSIFIFLLFFGRRGAKVAALLAGGEKKKSAYSYHNISGKQPDDPVGMRSLGRVIFLGDWSRLDAASSGGQGENQPARKLHQKKNQLRLVLLLQGLLAMMGLHSSMDVMSATTAAHESGSGFRGQGIGQI